MAAFSPPESRHALDSDGLSAPEISFWGAWAGDEMVGCVALKALEGERGELKSMRSAARHRREGIGQQMLDFVIAEARSRRYRRLYLETGAMAEFEPARALYARAGFGECGPFDGYVADRNSVFMVLALD